MSETNLRFKVGDKVVPHRKLGSKESLSQSIVWRRARNKGQNYLWVTKIISSTELSQWQGVEYVLDTDPNTRTGDYYQGSDLEPYDERIVWGPPICTIGNYKYELSFNGNTRYYDTHIIGGYWESDSWSDLQGEIKEKKEDRLFTRKSTKKVQERVFSFHKKRTSRKKKVGKNIQRIAKNQVKTIVNSYPVKDIS